MGLESLALNQAQLPSPQSCGRDGCTRPQRGARLCGAARRCAADGAREGPGCALSVVLERAGSEGAGHRR